MKRASTSFPVPEFSLQEHGGVGRGDLGRLPQHSPPFRRLSNHTKRTRLPVRSSVRLRTTVERAAVIAMLGLSLRANNAIAGGWQSPESTDRPRLALCRHFASGEMLDNKWRSARCDGRLAAVSDFQ
jgi:hypothetical protein